MSAAPQSPYPPVELKEKAPKPCNFSRIMIGPSGGEIAIWAKERFFLLERRRPPPFANLVVGRMHDRNSESADRLRHYFGPDLTIPIRWDPSGRVLYGRATRDRIVAIDADTGRVEERGALDPALQFVDLRAITHGNVSALDKPELLAQAKRVGVDFYRGHATLGEDVTFLGARKGDLTLLRTSHQPVSPAPEVRASYTRWILGFPDDRDFEGGLAYVGAPGKDGLRYLPYQLPLIDLATGRVAGKFNGAEILLRREGALAEPLAELRRKLASGGLILDASLSGGTLALLIRSGRGEIGISRLSARGLTEKRLCKVGDGLPSHVAAKLAAQTELKRIRIFNVDRAGREAYAPGLPIAIHYQGGTAPGRDALLVFPGGPTGSMSDAYVPAPLGRLISPNRDVIVVNYAGSVGGGLSLTRRLTEGGIGAIEEDVGAVVKWLDRQNYRRVFLDGGSFGGVPATIALARFPARFEAAILSVPALKLKEPEAWVKSGAFGAADAAGQRAFEEGIFGGSAGRARFAADLDRLVASAPYRAQDRFIFASLDPSSTPDDLPPGNKAAVTMLRGHHQTLSAGDDYLREVLAMVERTAP
ncbi:MAG TPA: prolyl oligopeptidase family serine peptidase [Allosphingosinicella sp.]|nr:prolyl oligopeptidase family serine peptidase [Allosphingosinicella sp.]